MIVIEIQSREGEAHGLSARGHAGYAEAGEDIVCAAVSALMLTAAIAIEKRGGAPHIEREPVLAEVSVEGITSQEERLQAITILGATADGLRAMEKEYSRYITIREV